MVIAEISSILLLSFLILIAGLFLQYYYQRWPVRNFPPGPTGYPIVGSLLQTGNDKRFYFHTTAARLVKRYGNVCSMMLDTPLVIANGYDAISELVQANKGYDFASRKDPMYTVELYNPKKMGLFAADFSARWQQHRTFTLSTLRGFGFGKASFEGKIMNEVQCVLNVLKDLPKIPQDISILLTISVANVMCDTIMGHHYRHDDSEFQTILDVMYGWLKSFADTKMVLLNYVPFTRLFFRKTAQNFTDMYNNFCNILMKEVDEHQKDHDSESEPRDFVDCYLTKMAIEPETFSREELRHVLADLFVGSTDTTANTLKFGILYMILYPDVQEKVNQEIVKVVGTSRLPCTADRNSMPYTMAAISEINRLSTVAVALPRCATVDTTLAGYSIPKGTNVIGNLWGLHHDPDLWPDPYKFDPTRHLNAKGEFVRSPYLMSFGAGRRVCMGETLAKMELFLFFSSLLQQFQFTLPPDAEKPSTDPVPGFVIHPEPYQVIITEIGSI